LSHCIKGRIAPKASTRLHLFAASAGHCQNPSCRTELFRNVKGAEINLAEMAHIIAANSGGARADTESLSDVERSEFDNLILLCPNCHTLIDKAPADYPVDEIRRWKQCHADAVKGAFGFLNVSSRPEARRYIERLLAENRAVFLQYGPDSDERFNPESEAPARWRQAVRKVLIPNGELILQFVDQNHDLLSPEEKIAVADYRVHLTDLRDRHASSPPAGTGARFPTRMSSIFQERTEV
jgi:hypothetical protein